MKMSNPILASASSPAADYASAEVLVKHDYRNIKIGPNTTVSLDLEEVKKQLERDIYKALGGPCLEFGA